MMGRFVREAWIAVAVLVLAAGLASAQSTNLGAIAGVVKDATGGVMPGVTVEVTSPTMLERSRTVVTDGEGLYKVLDLRPGTYAVTFTLQGFGAVKREGIDLSAGFTATVNAELKVGSLEETLTVSGQAPMVDTFNTRQQTVMNRDVMDTVPTARTGASSIWSPTMRRPSTGSCAGRPPTRRGGKAGPR